MNVLRKRPLLRAAAISLIPLLAPALHALSTPVGSTSPVQSVAITITTAGTTSSDLNTAAIILTKGSPGYDFALSPGGSCKLATTYKVGDTCTMDYTFTPQAPGLRLGAVELFDPTGTVVLGTALISAIGTGPVAAFPGNPAPLTLGSGFSEPRGVALDPANNIFVADYANSQVKEILADGGHPSSTSTVVTLGSGFNYPSAVALDGAGNVYVADTDNSAVKEILAFGGNLSATSPVIPIGSGFISPTGVAVDRFGNVFVADAGNGAVKEILASNGTTSAASTVVTVGHGFTYPTGVAVDNMGNVFVADYLGANVKEILASNGTVSSTSLVQTIGSGFSQPFAVSLNAAGDVLVGDVGLNAVKIILAVNGLLSPTSTVHTIVGGYAGPYGVANDGKGNIVFSASYDGNAVIALPLGTPANLAFQPSTIGVESSDSPQTFQLVNLGNAPLDLSILNTSVNFAVDPASTTCTTSTVLDANTFCTIGVDFIPGIIGPIQGALNLGDQQGSGSASLYGNGLGYTTSTTFTVSPTTVAIGQMDKWTATVTRTSGPAGTPVGSVLITQGPYAIGNYPIFHGVATIDMPIQAIAQNAPYTLTATYSGDALDGTSSAAASLTVYSPGPYSTATALSVKQIGPHVVFTANVSRTSGSAGFPTGTVTFTYGGTHVIGTYPCVSGVASFTVSPTTPYANVIVTARYNGDRLDSTSTGSGSLTVAPTGPYPTTTALTISPDSGSVNQNITFTATVTRASGPSANPTGSVVFSYGGTYILGTQALTAGVASITVPIATYVPNGTFPIAATYSGDTSDLASTTTTTITVTPPQL